MQIAERITIGGAAELHQNEEKILTEVMLGNFVVKPSGNGMGQLVKGVDPSLTQQPSDTMSTTLSLTDLQSLEQNLQTLFSFAKNAIDGFIPTLTTTKSSFIFQVETVEGWTDGQSDSQRYKQMGNAVTVNVIEWIGNQMRKSEENNGTA